MDKILVSVNVPALNESYDIFIPPDSPMHEVQELIKKAVSSLSHGQFLAATDTILCFGNSGAIVNINLSVWELGIRNGSRLILI